MAIGTAGEITIYVRRQGHEVGTNTLTNYTDYLMAFVLNKKLNRLTNFEGTFISIDTADEITDFTAGSAMYILVGEVLVDKIIMEQPKFNTDGTVNVVGTSSTGVADLPRRLATELITRSFVGVGADDIIDNTGSDPRGISVEDDDTAICVTDVTGSTSSVCNLNFAGTPRMVAVSQLCNASDQEWYMDYGTNDASPYSEGDILYIVTRVGDSSSQYTFDLYDQTDSNALSVVNNTENASIVNDIEIYSVDNTNTQTSTNIFHATTVRDKLDGDMDSWLNEELNDSETGVDISAIGDFADGDTILIGLEQMVVVSGGGTTTLTVTRGASPAYHKKGTDVVRLTDSGDASITITVDDTTDFDASGTLYIGSESIDYTGKPDGTTFTGCTRTAASAYAHGDGAPVYASDTMDSPAASSSILTYGVHSRSLESSTISSKNDLDIQAERVITNFKDPVERIQVEAADPLDFLETSGVVVGDTITINNSSLEDITDGDYRVIGFDFTYDYGSFGLIIHTINDGMRVIDISDYLLHTEKLMNHVGSSRQAADYLGGSNIDPVYFNGTNFIIDVSEHVTVSGGSTLVFETRGGILVNDKAGAGYIYLLGAGEIRTSTDLGVWLGDDAGANNFLVKSNDDARTAFSVSSTGIVTINEAFAFPVADGDANYILQTDGAGSLSWVASGGASDNWSDIGDYLEPNTDGDGVRLNDASRNNSLQRITNTAMGDGESEVWASQASHYLSSSEPIKIDSTVAVGIESSGKMGIEIGSTGSDWFSVITGTTKLFTVDGDGGGTTSVGTLTVGDSPDSYTFPAADGGVSGYVLITDANGNLSWAANGAGLWEEANNLLNPISSTNGWRIFDSGETESLLCRHDSGNSYFELESSINFHIRAVSGALYLDVGASNFIINNLGDTNGNSIFKVRNSDDDELFTINSGGGFELNPLGTEDVTINLPTTNTNSSVNILNSDSKYVFYVNGAATAVLGQNDDINGHLQIMGGSDLGDVGSIVCFEQATSNPDYIQMYYDKSTSTGYVYVNDGDIELTTDGISDTAILSARSAKISCNAGGTPHDVWAKLRSNNGDTSFGVRNTTPASIFTVASNGDCHVYGKLTVDGATDPPLVLYDPQTHEQIRELAKKQIPPEKQDGGGLFWNKDKKLLEVYVASEDKFYSLDGKEVN